MSTGEVWTILSVWHQKYVNLMLFYTQFPHWQLNYFIPIKLRNNNTYHVLQSKCIPQVPIVIGGWQWHGLSLMIIPESIQGTKCRSQVVCCEYTSDFDSPNSKVPRVCVTGETINNSRTTSKSSMTRAMTIQSMTEAQQNQPSKCQMLRPSSTAYYTMTTFADCVQTNGARSGVA